jgi:integrase/recombinase XerD
LLRQLPDKWQVFIIMQVTYEQVLSDYLQFQEMECGLSANSLAAYRKDILEFGDIFKLKGNFKISYKTVNEYLHWLSSHNRKPSSIARKISSLRGFYKYLNEKALIEKNPFENARVPKIMRYHPDYLSVEEIEQILDQPSHHDKNYIRDTAILELLYGTGMRISELINLKLTSVYDEIGFIKITGKGNKERLVPYGSFARNAVENYLTKIREKKKVDTESEFLFLSNRNQKMSRTGVWKTIKKYVSRSGIPKDATPHTFRHSFATHMIEGGADLRSVQEFLGHSSITTTQIYTQVDKEYLLSVHRDYHPRERIYNPGDN